MPTLRKNNDSLIYFRQAITFLFKNKDYVKKVDHRLVVDSDHYIG